MPFTNVAGADLYWKREGIDDGPALVLLNSIGTDMDLWEPVLPHVAERFSILRMDTRGHGASRAQPGDSALATLASDVLAVADAAGLTRFSVAGVSLGGMIGMELALSAADRVEKLIAVCTSSTMDSAAWNNRIVKVRTEGMSAIAALAMGRFLTDPASDGAVSPATYQTVLRQLLTMDAQGYAGCGAAIRDMDLSSRIADIRAPTLVVTGTRDTSTPFAGHGEHLVKGIAGAAHVALDAAHLAPLEAPEALAEAIVSFLES